MRLRSGNLGREDGGGLNLGHDGGSSTRVEIPDLNLMDESDAISSDEGGFGFSDVSKTEGKPDGLTGETGARAEDEGKVMEAEIEENAGGQKSNGPVMLSACSTKVDQLIQKADSVIPSSSVVDVVMSLENDNEKMANQGEEEEVKEKHSEVNGVVGCEALCPQGLVISEVADGCDVSEDVSGLVCVKGDQEIVKEGHEECDPNLSRNEQTSSGALNELSEKRSVIEGSKQKFAESLERGAKEGSVQIFGKVLRSRVVPGNGLRNEAVGVHVRASPNKRKRENDDRGEAVTLTNGSLKLIADSMRSDDCGRSKTLIDHSNGEVIEMKKTPHRFKTDDKCPNGTPVKSSVSKRKRGRPKRSTYHSEVQACHMNEVHAVSEVEDEDLDSRSAATLKKFKHGKRKTFDSPKEKVEVSKVENEAGDVSKKSAGCSTQARRSERAKRVVDYCEKEAVLRKRASSCKVDDFENENEDVGSTRATSLNVKGKRGRPKREGANSALKMISQDKDDKIKVSVASNKVPSTKEISSDMKIITDGADNAVDSSTLRDTNGVSVKQKKGETSLAAEKNEIRNQIVDMLRSAGWTVQYRPRNGRQYNDAVYVNRQGKTHWSVTKAYSSLQREVEAGKVGNSKFSFTPLPDEVLSKLFRVVSKTRSDKNKKKKHKGDGDSSDEDDTRDTKKHKHSALKRKAAVRGGSQSKRRCTLVARRSKGSNSESNDAVAHSGKHSILAWMIDSGAVSLSGKVHCMNRRKTKILLEGSITRDGIHCQCCKEVKSVSEFEQHAGIKLSQPYENLYLESGQSFLQCLLDSWKKQELAGPTRFHSVNVDDDDPNDDTCAICGDGGDLMCCDGCPSTFHHDCLEIEEVPSGEWNCVYCSCKFCGTVGEAIDDCDSASSTLVSCCLCDKKYHQSCVDLKDVADVKSGRPTFCGESCEQIFDRLQSLIEAKCDLGDGYSWTLLQRSDIQAEGLLSEAQKIQNNAKLAVALAVMDECFVPIIDHRSGINLIRHVVYNCGSNFNRLNLSSFFTIVLEKGDEVISAASVRIHGKLLAEMPFIGTRNVYRRQGMCRRLLTAVELALGSLEVENLVIPAVPEVMDTWTLVFGFQPLEETVKRDMKSMNVLVFAHTDMLQKPLLKHDLGGKGVAVIENDAIEQLSGGADNSEVDDGCVNGSFDLNVMAPGIPESSSGERHENSGGELKSSNGFGEPDDADKVESQPSAMESRDTQMVNAILVKNADKATESTGNSCGLIKLDSCATEEDGHDHDGNLNSAKITSGERTFKPDLNLMGDSVSELNDCSEPNAVDHENGGDCVLPGNSDFCKRQEIPCGNAVNLSSLSASPEAEIIGSDNTVDNHEAQAQNIPLGANSESGFPDVKSSSKSELQDTTISSNPSGVSSNGSLLSVSKRPGTSVDCCESDPLACSRVGHLTSETSCNTSSAGGKSSATGLSHGNGLPMVGSN